MPYSFPDQRAGKSQSSILDLRSNRRLHRNQRQLPHVKTRTRALLAIVLITSGIVSAEPPVPVMETLRAAVESLADGDAPGFLDHFDPATTNFAQIRVD